MMRERGLRVVGLDISREAAGIAWRRQQVPAVVRDLERAPLRAGSFAGLTMFHVMEHLYDPRAYLRGGARTAGAGRPPGGAGAERRVLAGALLGSAWNGAGHPAAPDQFPRTRSGEDAGELRLRSAAPQISSRCATIPRGWRAAWRRRSTRWRAACGASPKSGGARLAKDLTYFALVVASLPFAVAEAACRRGLDA